MKRLALISLLAMSACGYTGPQNDASNCGSFVLQSRGITVREAARLMLEEPGPLKPADWSNQTWYSVLQTCVKEAPARAQAEASANFARGFARGLATPHYSSTVYIYDRRRR